MWELLPWKERTGLSFLASLTLKACFCISCWVQYFFLFSDVCAALFEFCNTSVINVPGVEIAAKLILILCRDVQISLFFFFSLFSRGLLVKNATNTHAFYTHTPRYPQSISKHGTPLLPQSHTQIRQTSQNMCTHEQIQTPTS